MPIMNQVSHTIFILVAFLSILSGIRYFQYRTPMARWGGGYLLCLAVELVSFSIRLVIPPSSSFQFWYVLQVVSFYFLPVFWLVFVVEFFVQHQGINWRILFPILCIPAFILISSSPQWPLRQASVGMLPQINGSYGLIVNISFYSLGLLAAYTLIRLCLKSNSYNQKLGFPMLVGTLFLLLMNVLDQAGLKLFNPIPMIQIGLASTGFLFYIVTVIWRFGGILPISRESVFDNLHTGVLILDYYDKVVDINTSAQEILGLQRKIVLNQKLSAVWPFGAQLISEHSNELFIEQECNLSRDHQEFFYNIAISKFVGLNDASTGRMVVLRNITGREQMEKALNDRAQELLHTNAILAALAEVNIHLQTASDPFELNAILGTELRKLGLHCFIARLDPDSNELAISYLSAFPETMAKIEKILRNKLVGYRVDRDQFAPLYEILESKKISFSKYQSGDLKDTDGMLPTYLLEQVMRLIGLQADMAALVLPLVTGERTLGVMGVWGETLKQEDISPFQIFANQVAHVIERAVLYEIEIQRSAELARVNNLIVALSRVASALGTTSNSEVVLDTLGKELEKVGLRCALVSFDEELETAFIKYTSIQPELIGSIEKITGMQLKNYSIPRHFWPGVKITTNDKTPIWYPNAYEIIYRLFPMVPEGVAKKFYPSLSFTQEDKFCIIPLTINEKVIGAMSIWGPHLRQEDGLILSAFGSQVAGIIRNIENYESEVLRTDELARSNAMILALSQVAAQLDTTSNLSQVFETLGRELNNIQVNCMVGTLDDAKQIMKIEYISISQDVFKMAEKLGAFLPKEFTIPRRLWPTDKAVTDKAPFWDPDPIGSASKMFPYIPKQIFIKAFEFAGMSPDDQVCYLPMISEEDVIGIMAVWGSDLKQQDIHGLSVFANQVATALNNARLFDQAQKEIVDRTQTEARAREALKEKEVLLKEVHHRVKNNLQIISSLLNLQAGQASDPMTIDILRESQTRVRSMALIHEKLYQSDDLAGVDFGAYLQSLVNSLAQTYRVNPDKVAIQVHTEKIALTIDTAIPCGLIVNELVSNSLKYAFPAESSGTINVSCKHSQGDHYCLAVSDDGVGLPAEFDIETSSSLGLKLVTSLVRQIDGELVMDHTTGIRFEINF